MRHFHVIICLFLILLTAGCGQTSSQSSSGSTPSLWSESETAAKSAKWLKDLSISLSPSAEIVSAMEVFHVPNILEGKTRSLIHSMGMEQFYDSSLLSTVLSTLQTEYQNRVSILEKAGISMVRDVVAIGFWEISEPSKGEYHDDITDLIINTRGNYIKNSVVINPIALWDQLAAGYSSREASNNLYSGGDYFVLKQNTGPGPASDLLSYKNFLNHLAGRYNLNYFQIGNEPESDAGPYCGSPEAYVDLLKNTRSALAGYVLLNGGALEFINTSSVSNFWNTVFSSGGGQYFDIMNIHYNLMRSRDHTIADISSFEAILDYYNNLSGAKPIWLTEFGTYAGTQDGIVQSEEYQAEWCLKTFCFGAARGVKKVFVDLIGRGDNIIEESKLFYTSQVSSNWTARLLVYTAKLMNYKLTGFSNCDEIIKNEQYKFTGGIKTIYALWGNGSLPVELAGKELKITDIYGNETASSTLTLTDHPVFVELN